METKWRQAYRIAIESVEVLEHDAVCVLEAEGIAARAEHKEPGQRTYHTKKVNN